MRYAFRTHFKTLDLRVQERYKELQTSNNTGKQALMDEIIMNAIPNGTRYNMKPEPTAILVSKLCYTADIHYKDRQHLGLTYTEIKARLGGDAAVQEGLDRKDIFIGTDDMYYLKRTTRGEKRTHDESKSVETQHHGVTDKQAELAQFEMLVDVGDWLAIDFDNIGSRSSASSDVPAALGGEPGSKLMEHVQQAFDSATRLTLSVKKTLQEMVKITGSSTSVALVQRGVQLSKAMVPSSEDIEHFLLTPVHLLDRSKVVSSLKEAATHFQALDIFRAEIEATLRHVKRTNWNSV